MLAQQSRILQASFLQLQNALRSPQLTVEQRLGVTIRAQQIHQQLLALQHLGNFKDSSLIELKAAALKPTKDLSLPKLTAAQIQNRRFSIYIKKLSLND